MQKLILFLFLITSQSLAQTNLTLSAGHGTWSMNTMKTWQEEYKNTFPVEAKTVSSFPSYWFFEASATQQRDRWIRGLALSNGSTGGRVYYSDYSGMIGFDQHLSFYSLGAIIGRVLNSNHEKLRIVSAIRPGVMLSKVGYEHEQIVNGETTEDISNTFRSLNLTVQPTFSVSRKFGPIGLELMAGYHLTVVGGKLTYDDEANIPPDQGNLDYLVLLSGQTPVKANWSGFRLSLGVNYWFGK